MTVNVHIYRWAWSDWSVRTSNSDWLVDSTTHFYPTTAIRSAAAEFDELVYGRDHDNPHTSGGLAGEKRVCIIASLSSRKEPLISLAETTVLLRNYASGRTCATLEIRGIPETIRKKNNTYRMHLPDTTCYSKSRKSATVQQRRAWIVNQEDSTTAYTRLIRKGKRYYLRRPTSISNGMNE